MQKITPCLWFDTQAEEAVAFYRTIFRKSEVTATTRYDAASAEVSGMPDGSVLTVAFRLDGQEFLALNGGPLFKFTPAISLMVTCKDQPEIDRFWEGLSDGGEKGQCGWLTDRYGVSWQVVPDVLDRMITDPDPARAARVMKALLPMTKIVIADLERAYTG
jgi:predicted 3-demethylubiquinone-9 3-methyltransferase (glyoxalase superfamily)